MVFKLFGFKGSLYGRRKESKQSKDDVVCTSYRVNPEFLESLPPPVLQSNPASTSREIRSKDLLFEKGKPNGSVPQQVITRKQTDHSQSNDTPMIISKNEVVKERKPAIKPIAKDIFTSPTENRSEKRKDDAVDIATAIKETPLNPVGVNNNEAEVSPISNMFSTGRDSDNEKKSTLIFLTENHDDVEAREVEHNKNSNIYEELMLNKFLRRSSTNSEPDEQSIPRNSATDSESEINFGQPQRSSGDSYGKINFVQSNRFVSRNHDANNHGNAEMYSSQASSLFFGEPEPETITLGKTKKRAPARPSEADSETSA